MTKDVIFVDFSHNKGDNDGKPPTGGNGGNEMESRITAVETHIEHIREDIQEIKTDIKDMNQKVDNRTSMLIGLVVVSILIPIALKYWG